MDRKKRIAEAAIEREQRKGEGKKRGGQEIKTVFFVSNLPDGGIFFFFPPRHIFPWEQNKKAAIKRVRTEFQEIRTQIQLNIATYCESKKCSLDFLKVEYHFSAGMPLIWNLNSVAVVQEDDNWGKEKSGWIQIEIKFFCFPSLFSVFFFFSSTLFLSLFLFL